MKELSFLLKKLEILEQINPKLSQRMEIKIRVEINAIENRKIQKRQ